MPQLESNVLAMRAEKPGVNLRLSVVTETDFQPLGFFVWGVNSATIIRHVMIGTHVVGWTRGRNANLFVPALPFHMVRELARLDPIYGADGWNGDRYLPMYPARAGTSLSIEFEGVAQEVAFWGMRQKRQAFRTVNGSRGAQ